MNLGLSIKEYACVQGHGAGGDPSIHSFITILIIILIHFLVRHVMMRELGRKDKKEGVNMELSLWVA